MRRRGGWYWLMLALLVLASVVAHGGHSGAAPLQPSVETRAETASGHRHASAGQSQVEEHAHIPCVIPRGPDSVTRPGGVCEWAPEDLRGSGTSPSNLDRPPDLT